MDFKDTLLHFIHSGDFKMANQAEDLCLFHQHCGKIPLAVAGKGTYDLLEEL